MEGRRYEVAGSVVWTRTDLEALPDKATVVRVTSMLIDSGKGLELCVSGVDESLPPQCAGPVVDGLDPTGWTETIDDVTWGTHTVIVAWPPVDKHLTLITDQQSLLLERIGDEAPDGLPADCEEIDNFVHRDAISFFANDNPDRTARGRSVNNDAVVVLAVVEEHLEDVREELTTAEAEPCLEPVEYSTTQLSSAQDRLAEEGLYNPEGPVLGSGSGNALNRLAINVAVATSARRDVGRRTVQSYGKSAGLQSV